MPYVGLRIFMNFPTYPWNIPQTLQPTLYEGIPFIWGFGEAWGKLQGYVGVLLELVIRHATATCTHHGAKRPYLLRLQAIGGRICHDHCRSCPEIFMVPSGDWQVAGCTIIHRYADVFFPQATCSSTNSLSRTSRTVSEGQAIALGAYPGAPHTRRTACRKRQKNGPRQWIGGM